MSQAENQDNVLPQNAPRKGDHIVDLKSITNEEIDKLRDVTNQMREAVELAHTDKDSAKAIIEKLAEVSQLYGTNPDAIADLLNETDLKNRGGKFPINKAPGFIYYDHRSLWCFKHDNCFRVAIVKLIHNNIFDHFISLVILFNSVMLGMRDFHHVYKRQDDEDDEPGEPKLSDNNKLLEHIGLYLSGIFFVECVLKIIGMGFVWHKNSYLRDGWNKLDFFVVAISFMDFIPALEKYSALKILRTLRILRPLRSVNKIKGMKIIINSFLASIPGLCNVCFFLFFVLSIFGIFGVHQFKGQTYQRCRVTEAPTAIKSDEWLLLGCDSEALSEVPLDDQNLALQQQCYALPKEWEMIDEELYENAAWLCASDQTCKSYYFKNDNICDEPYIDANGDEVIASCTCGAPGSEQYNLDKNIDKNLKSNEQMFFDIAGFEDFIKAMFTIFIAITLEGWSIMMVNYQDAGSQWISPIFFILLVLFGAFFALNLVLAEVIVSFFDAKALQEEKDAAEAKVEKQAQIDKDEAIEYQKSQENSKENSRQNSEREHKTPQENLIDVSQSSKTVSRVQESNGLPDITGARKFDVDRMGKLEAAYDHAQQEGIELSCPLSDEQRSSQADASVSRAGASKLADPASKPITEEDNDSMSNSDQSEKAKEATEEEELVEGEQECDIKARQRAETNRFYGCFYYIVTGHAFNFFIFGLIILNTLLLASDGYPSSQAKQDFFYIANEFFTWIFFAELVFKIIGLGPKNYIADSYNIFDSVVVGFSLIDWVIEMSVDQENLGGGAEALQAIKALRLLRMIKLARSWSAMQDILKKTYASLAELVYVFIILFLFMYIFALLGMEIFAYQCRFTPDLDGELVTDVAADYAADKPMSSPRENFDDTIAAVTTVFILTIGEDWPVVMYNYTRVYNHSQLIMLYFLITYSMGNFAMLSLFTAVLLSKFEEKDEEIEKEGEDEDKDDEEDDSKPKKPCLNKCVTFLRNFKLEYYRAFATEKLAQAIKQEVELLEEHDEIAWKAKHQSISDRKIAPAPTTNGEQSLSSSNLKNNLDDSIHAQPVDQEGQVVKQPSTPPKVQNRCKSETDKSGAKAKETVYNSVKIGSQSNEKVTGSQAWAFNRMVTRTSEKKLHYRGRSQFALSHLKVLENDEVDASEASAKLKERITGNSLFCLGPDNAFRFECYKFVMWPWFDRIILTFIVISTIMLAIDTPLSDKESSMIIFCQYADYVMTTVFVLEMCIKIIAFGFVTSGKESYILNGWNVLDFLIVASAIFSIIFAQYEIAFLKALRLLRILRPLRLISRNKSLKLAITSLINSVPDIVSLLVITNFFIVMMAILCTTLLAGKFFYCDTSHIELDHDYTFGLVETKWDCLNIGGEWLNPDLNFDNTMQSILTLMTIQTTEGWIGVMWSSVDAKGIDIEPERDYNRFYIIFFFLLIVIICLLFLNLFVGIVCETYNTEKSILSLNHKLKSAEEIWINVQLQAYTAKPVIYTEIDKPGVGACRNNIIKLITHPAFDWFIMSCILANTVILAVQWYQMDQAPLVVFGYINIVFSIIFTVEAIIKLIGMKGNYFKDTWNVFDFVVVCITLIVFTMKFIPQITIDMSSQATIVRVLRVLRVLKLVKRAKKLQIIAQTVLEAIPSMGSLGVLLLLFLFLFAVIGNQLFSFVQLQGDLNRQFNFQTFTSSFLLLVRCATGEGWNALMFDTARQHSITFQCDPNANYESTYANGGETQGCGYSAAVAYFIVFLFVVCYVFLNLFIAIVVDTYCAMGEAFGLPVTTSGCEEFVEYWKKYDPNATGYISIGDLSALVTDLAANDNEFFSHNKAEMLEDGHRAKYIRDWELPCYKNFSCYMFYDVLLLTCRDTCMVALYPKAKRETIRKGIERRALNKGLEVPEDEMEILVRQRILRNRDHHWQFKNNVLSLNEKDDRIDLINQLRQQSAKVGRRLAQKNVDTWVKTENWDGLYTSKHVWAAQLIIKELKAHVDKRNNKLLTPPVTGLMGMGATVSETTVNFEDKTKIDKTGQASNKKLQGQAVGSQEFDLPPSHQKIPSELTQLNQGPPDSAPKNVSTSKGETPLDMPNQRSSTPKLNTVKPSPSVGVFDETNSREPVSGNWIQQEANTGAVASTLKEDQDKQ